MRAAGRVGRTVVLRLRFDDFSRATRSHTLPHATAHTETILATARGLLAVAMPLIEARGLTLVGVAVANLENDLPISSCCRSTVAAAAPRRGARRGARAVRVDGDHAGRAARARPGAVGAAAPRLTRFVWMPPPARTPEQRKHDTLQRLEHDVDAWIATADGDSETPYLVPLSFLWDGGTVLVATLAASPTGRNLQATGKARVGIGPTRDVVLIEGTVDAVPATEIPAEVGDAFAAKTGFEPRALAGPYLYFRIRPQRIQAWREANELAGRELMRDGEWLVA